MEISVAIILLCGIITALVWRTEKQKEKIQKLEYDIHILEFTVGMLECEVDELRGDK